VNMPFRSVWIAPLLLSPGLVAQDQPTTTTLRAFPQSIRLDSGLDRQRVFAASHDDVLGVTSWTRDVAWTVTDPTIVAVETRDGVATLSPRKDGETELVGVVSGIETRAKVLVANCASSPLASFRNEVIPVLTANGCNSGGCHGAAAGKNGFSLTLFGYDPDRDHRAITRELRGRRVDLLAPEQSLLLQKATASVPHQGGKRMEVGSDDYRRIVEWIEQGAKDDRASAPAVTAIEVFPTTATLTGLGAKLPFSVRARYADGTDADVTGRVSWSSGNEGSARIERGMLEATGRGEAVVLARFAGLAAIARVRVHADATPFALADEPAGGAIDGFVRKALTAAKTQRAAPCTDEQFVRRVYVDLLGLLPTPDAVRAFLADTRPDKRAQLVDELLERPEFAALQAATWAEVLQVDAQTMEQKGASMIGRWLRAQFEQKRPFDETVRELLTASGATFTNAPANYQLIARQPHLVAEKTAQVFLGVRLQCAQCHNHPFERWTMDDYYGLAAFFGQVGKKRGLDPYENVVWDRGDGEVRNLRNGAVAEPRLLGAGKVTIEKGTDRRAVFADWLVANDNPWFARNVANRVWARMFGRGLVDPVDDVRIGNPPSHPELLDHLASALAASRYDVRVLFREISASRTYQSAGLPADAHPSTFAGIAPRRLSAEALLDAISSVTAAPTKYPGAPLGATANAVDGGRGTVAFLDAFGRPARESSCACDRRDEPTLGQTLHLINGDTILQKLGSAQGRLRRSLAEKREPQAMLEDLWLAAYSRMPSPDESQRVLAVVPVGDAKAALAAWEDIYWSVLNSKEFLFQH
jgi:Protein of unknown function (DUF1549)/Protein of unknown function (DUF1553)